MDPLSQHYTRGDLRQRVLDALIASGKNPKSLRQVDLASLDQFHLGGLPATRELAKLVGLGPGTRVVDLGGGYGGPARTLAAEFGCKVDVVDITEEFCTLGELLTELTGLQARVDFHNGSALELPFSGGTYDVAWTQFSTMNIGNKMRLYREISRVLRHGGRYAFHEVLEGPDRKPLEFPVPWAADQSISSLRTPEETRELLADAGFEEVEWKDVTEVAQAAARRMGSGPPAAAAQLVHPDTIETMMANLVRNLDEGRVVAVMAVMQKAL